MTEWKVPLFDLELGKEEYTAISDVLDSRWLTMGGVTSAFESAFAAYLGVRHAFAVSSGTAAMHLAHSALGGRVGDEVICPSLTFVATANAIRYTGADPVFADIEDLNDLTISPEKVESSITARTKGVVVVHYGGFPCDMDGIMEIAERHNLYVVEDVAHAPGADYISRLTPHASPQKLGTIGHVGCFSFFSNKNMTTGEGGMIVTNSDELAEHIRLLRSHGMTSLTWDRHKGHDFTYDVITLGYNYRIDEIRSALGQIQLERLEENNRKRKNLWELYRSKLHGMEEIAVPFPNFPGTSAYHFLPVILSSQIDRRKFMTHLREKGIQSSIHYPPVHLFSYYRKVISSGKVDLPLTEHAGKTEVTLPFFPAMDETRVDYVVSNIKRFFAGKQTI